MLIFKLFVSLFKIILNKKVAQFNSSDIFNYEFSSYTPTLSQDCPSKEKCCKKYKKKKKKYCKNCPNHL